MTQHGSGPNRTQVGVVNSGRILKPLTRATGRAIVWTCDWEASAAWGSASSGPHSVHGSRPRTRRGAGLRVACRHGPGGTRQTDANRSRRFSPEGPWLPTLQQ